MLGQLRNHPLKLVDQSYLGGKITLGDNEPLTQLLDVIDLVWGKQSLHVNDNTASLYSKLVCAFSEVMYVYPFAMRAHTVEIIAIKEIVQLRLIKLDGLVITKRVGPMEALILDAFL